MSITFEVVKEFLMFLCAFDCTTDSGNVMHVKTNTSPSSSCNLRAHFRFGLTIAVPVENLSETRMNHLLPK